MLNGLKNFLQIINDNWATIVMIATLVYAIYRKADATIKEWRAKSEAEKEAEIQRQIAAAKKVLGEEILKFVSKAEIEWQSDTCKLGPIRRADVIEKIYAKYPVLLYAASQEEMLKYIDKCIEDALKVVRETIRKETEINN